VYDVCSRAVPAAENLPEISVAVQPLLGAVSVEMGRDPFERGP